MAAQTLTSDELQALLAKAEGDENIHAENLVAALNIAIRYTPPCTQRAAWIQNLKQLQQGGDVYVRYER